MSAPAPDPAPTAPAAPAAAAAPVIPTREDERRQTARLLTYRLVPLWIFLFVFGLSLVWQAAARGETITAEKVQAAALTSLVIALFIGAPIGIRYFDPLPPKK